MEMERMPIFRVTVKKIIERLSDLQDISIDDFKQEVEDQFDGYDYKDVEEVTGFDKWCDISKDGKYELNVGIDHPHAYQFTLFVETKDGKATIYNVL